MAKFKLTISDAKFIKKNGKLIVRKRGNLYKIDKFYRLVDVSIDDQTISGKFKDMPTEGFNYFDIVMTDTARDILF